MVDQRLAKATSRYVAGLFWFQRQFLRYYFMAPPRWRVLLRTGLARKRMLPGFASLGAVRSGTTAFADYLMQHPCVVLPLAKEVGMGTQVGWRAIEAQFPSLREKAMVERKYGMAVTGYCTPVLPSLLFPFLASAMMPRLKILLLLRNPIERTFSHWRWDQALSSRISTDPLWRNAPDFDEIVRLEIGALESKATSGFSCLAGANCGGYVQHSIYLPFLKTLFRFYDRKDAMVINSADFFADPPGVAKDAYRFLGLPDYEPAELPVRNAGPKKKLAPATRRQLADFFEPLNEELYAFLGRDLGWR